MLASHHTLYRENTNLQALIPFKLPNRLLRKDMSARNQINRLHSGTERLCRDRTDPALAALVAVRMRAVRGVLAALSVDLEMKLNYIPERLDPPAQDLLAVGFGADAFAVVAGEQELEDGVFVVKVAD
jgi:hypothetical protein